MGYPGDLPMPSKRSLRALGGKPRVSSASETAPDQPSPCYTRDLRWIPEQWREAQRRAGTSDPLLAPSGSCDHRGHPGAGDGAAYLSAEATTARDLDRGCLCALCLMLCALSPMPVPSTAPAGPRPCSTVKAAKITCSTQRTCAWALGPPNAPRRDRNFKKHSTATDGSTGKGLPGARPPGSFLPTPRLQSPDYTAQKKVPRARKNGVPMTQIDTAAHGL